MRKGWFAILGLLFLCVSAWADQATKGSICPEYGFHEEYTACTSCHDRKPVTYEHKQLNFQFAQLKGRTLVLNFRRDIDDFLVEEIRTALLTVPPSEYDTVRIEIASFGGGYFDALALIAMIEELQAQGKVVETVCYGYALSAGFLILISDTPGHRYCTSNSILMWHEIISFSFFSIQSVSDKESEAKIFRLLQDNVNEYIASHSSMSKEELDRRIKFKELWVTGREALKYGFVDHIIQ